MGPREEAQLQADSRQVYRGLLREAQEGARQAVARLRALSERYPAALPAELLAQAAPRPGERRGAPRLPGAGPRAADGWPAPPGGGAALVLEVSAAGLSLWLGWPAVPGETLLVAPVGDGSWLHAEVRHCRAEGSGWVAGCQVLGRHSA